VVERAQKAQVRAAKEVLATLNFVTWSPRRPGRRRVSSDADHVRGARSHVPGCLAVSSWWRRLVPQQVARGHQVTATTPP